MGMFTTTWYFDLVLRLIRIAKLKLVLRSIGVAKLKLRIMPCHSNSRLSEWLLQYLDLLLLDDAGDLMHAIQIYVVTSCNLTGLFLHHGWSDECPTRDYNIPGGKSKKSSTLLGVDHQFLFVISNVTKSLTQALGNQKPSWGNSISKCLRCNSLAYAWIKSKKVQMHEPNILKLRGKASLENA
ncbi:hypothetical protein MKW98_003526 [Papaver atlanticum]|uniref:Uncharacterized protein n=1 Tax=Papaver atlanticum TaxID=357466 RepID=A0AAD4XUV0_9MAGN|nr:hypothetical protein MKW98_003526 [Papaver atlanticum]